MNTTTKNTLGLSLLMLVKKLLSVLYKIPYQNLMGDRGFYVFQQVYPIFAIVMLLTGFVFPVVIGGLLRKHMFKLDAARVIKRKLWIFSLVVFAVLFLGNTWLARLMGDVLLAPVIRAISLYALFIPRLSYERGVLNARANTLKYFGYSIVIEQIARVIGILAVLFIFADWDIYTVATFSFLASMAGPALAFVYLYGKQGGDSPESFLPVKGEFSFAKQSIFLLMSAGMLGLFSFVDTFIVFNTLVRTYTHDESMVLRGILARGLPLLQGGTFFVSAVVSSFASQYDAAETEKERNKRQANALFKLLAFGVPATVGIWLLMPELNVLLFTTESSVFVLQVFILQLVPYSLLVFKAKALTLKGEDSFVMMSLLVGLLMKVTLTYPFVYSGGILGAAISSVISLTAMSLLLVYKSRTIFNVKLVFNLIGVTMATVVMWQGVRFIRPLIDAFYEPGRTNLLVRVFVLSLGGMAVYGLVLGLLKVIFYAFGRWVLDNEREKAKAPKVQQEVERKVKTVRLDKYLKVARIIKRRQTAKEVADAGKISVNGKVAKSSTPVAVGDEITLHYKTRTLLVRVAQIKDSTKKDDAAMMFEIISETPVE